VIVLFKAIWIIISAMGDYRTERDSMGEVKVPREALYGAQTQRALENFRINGTPFPRVFIRTMGLIKAAAAEVNRDLGLLDADKAGAIIKAAGEVAEGKHDDHFPIVVYQTGSGTSTNMNANEVIANRASKILKKTMGVHPNDHVNMGQSSNDVIPSAIHMSAYIQIEELLLPALRELESTLRKRARETKGIVKTGRTHLMDAMPLTMGQEIGGWAHQVEKGIKRIEAALPAISRLAIGGTAVGTGVNAHKKFAGMVIKKLAKSTGLTFKEARNHFSAQAAMDDVAALSAELKTTATALMKIANDLRWLNSGPTTGLAEITLPSLQPGSSIMPGKVNPVMCEAMMMVSAQVIGNDLTVSICNSMGNFQLNTMLPVIAHNLLESISIMGSGARAFSEKAVSGFTVNTKRIAELTGRNAVLVTALNPVLGYDRAAEVAKRAQAEGRSIKEVALEMTDIPEKDLDRLLDPKRLTGR
jgi:fumarate hydratase class II